MPKDLTKLIKGAPDSPGVYKFFNEGGDVIYVGKAKSLKKRLASYFQDRTDKGVKTQKLLENSTDISWTETNSEVEALILEDNLIKTLQPKYNILLKDDKTFQYIKVTTQRDYPEVLTVRRIEKDGAKYFGPKTSGTDVVRILESVKRIFKLCSVRNINLDPSGTPLEGAKVAVKIGNVPAKRPCLDFHIKRCIGPCAGMVTPQEYHKIIDEVVSFLSGDYKGAIDALKAQMMEYAKQQKFEQAGRLRDSIQAIERSTEKQLIRDTKLSDRDVVAYIEDLGRNFFNLFQIRGGRMISAEHFISEGGESPSEIMEAFLRDYYNLAADIPREVIISVPLEEPEVLEEYIRAKTDHAVHITHPERGTKDDLILLGEKNARSYAQQCRVSWLADSRTPEKALEQLSTSLKKAGVTIKGDLNRIECFDISHLSGTEVVASMSVFKKGIPYKPDYRLFRLKSTAGINDDFKSMTEVVRRRLNYLEAKLPEGYTIKKAKKADLADLKKEGTYYILRKKDKVVGYVGEKILNEKVHAIHDLWTDEKNKEGEWGYFLLKALIEKSKGSRLYTVCKKSEQEYYLSFGFDLLHDAPKEMKEAFEGIQLAYQKKKKDTSFTSTPDLMVIDGGKGQLSHAYAVLTEKGLEGVIPMISLAKKEEQVYVPTKPEHIGIAKDSEAGYLLQRLRDEAHRFAIELNRGSREKKMTASILDDIPGVGPKMRQRLLSHFGSVSAIKEATLEQLTAVAGEGVAREIKDIQA
jgi:excinuclease ABC subunit C